MLIAFEGIDGAGKGTQSLELARRLTDAGYRVRHLGFPRYSETFFGQRIGDFLNGRFGQLWDLPPFLISLLFAGDRLESRELLLSCIEEYDAVILDRYVASNVAHQSARCERQEQRDVQEWIEHIEYGIHQLPRADVNLLFDLPVAQAQALVAKKQQRDYTEQAADLQEADATYLGLVRETYLDIAGRQPNWQVISLLDGDRLRSVDEVATQVQKFIEPMLRRG
ncbi:MAG: thymidylate kinase [Planctomycetaceae bacterium]|nr:thymidylate kinase [Planctomycetaceae bacterium]